MSCCACAGSCNHVGNHSFCPAHGGFANPAAWIPMWDPAVNTTTTTVITTTDAEVLRRAALILRRRSKKPHGFMLRALCRILSDTADDLDVEGAA